MLSKLGAFTRHACRPTWSAVRQCRFSNVSTPIEENPLLQQSGLPPFDMVQVEHIKPAVTTLLAQMHSDFEQLEGQLSKSITEGTTVGYSDVVDAMEKIEAPVSSVWGIVQHLGGVMNSDELRAVEEELQGSVVDAFTRVGQSKAVFEALQAIDVSDLPATGLDDAQRRVVDSIRTNMALGGVGLEGNAKDLFNSNRVRLSELSSKFSNNVLDATKEFGIIVTDPAAMEGMPKSGRGIAAQMAVAAGHEEATAEDGPWKLGFDMPTFLPAMQHLRDRGLREQLYRAYVAKAGEENTPLIEETLKLRRQQAQILGYATHAEVSLATKMAGSVQAVDDLTTRLLEKARPAAEQELETLTAFAKERGFEGEKLELFDVAFWNERQSEELFGFKDEELRPYFALPNVLDGLFGLCKRLFGVEIVAADGQAPVWHKDVRFFNVVDETSGSHIASFYLDPFSRPENKRGGAWMDTCIQRSRVLQRKPVAYLVCNSSPPIGDTPSLMSFNDVRTLFHEAGHGLQHMLTEVPHAAAAGISNIEWDAVELPSQFMENWCFDRKTVIESGLAVHHETGQALPNDLFDKLCEQQKHNAGRALLRQL
eukprot:INCI17235.3.p1 GENE.INCI17235.3~~INCI17235.3.p1  ORF type:complete len:595 (-),score=127.98 INCI17235.3:2368-4152(-)